MDRQEALERWKRAGAMMADHDLDAVIAIDLSRDEILLGHQRWLTGYIAVGGPAAAVLHRDGTMALMSERIGQPAAAFYRDNGLPIELVNGFSPAVLARHLGGAGIRRIGIAEPASFSHAMATALREAVPDIGIIDVSAGFQRLRLRKTPGELALIRQSCAIADAVWGQMPDLFRIGRRYRDIIADIEHMMRIEGAESGFNLLLPLPFLGRGMQAMANPDRIEAGARYLMEVSPRYQGYYSQLTLPVTTHAADDRALRAYDDLVAAKRAAQPHMKPGADLTAIARTIEADLADSGHTIAGLSLGHFCGMALEEPRHDPAAPFLLEEGMTLIYHPVLGDADLRSLMCAETYVITADGAQRLNRHESAMLVVG